MNAELLDIERLVKMNDLKEVSNPIGFDRGEVPTVDGLYSSEIFGLTVNDRRYTYAYIDLGGYYLMPKAYNTLKMLNRNFEKMIYGTETFRITEEGVVEPDPEGGTGLDFLYKNWEKIKFPKNQSVKRNERIDFLTNHKKNVIFTRKWIVIPVFFRDVNRTSGSSGKTKVPEINDKYADIIRNVKMIESANTFDFMINKLKGKIQTDMYDIYILLKTKLEKKNGYFRKFLMGKSNDYCCRSVITAVSFHDNKFTDMKINYEYTGVPLYTACSLFTPFILWWVGRFFKNELGDSKNGFPINLQGKDKPIYVHLKDPEIEFNSDYIAKQLDRMIENPSSRFDQIYLPVEDDDKKKFGLKGDAIMKFKGRYVRENSTGTSIDNVRPMTWTDIFYMAAVDVTSDKFIEITRYPLLDYLGTYFSRPYVISTRETVPVIYNGILYEKYQKIYVSLRGRSLDKYFVDALKIYPEYLPGLDGDHDGDQTTTKGIFSQEANEEARRIMYSKKNILTTDGGLIRTIGNEGLQTLYTFTKFH